MHNFIYEVIGKRVIKQKDVKFRKDGNHYLAINLEIGGLIVSLNQTSSDVFLNCDGKRSMDDIVSIFKEKYPDVDQEVIKYDVAKCVSDLEIMQLVSLVTC